MKRKGAFAIAAVMALSMVGWAAPAAASGSDGCTPGYWKNHTESWPSDGNPDPTGTPISSSDDWGTWFEGDLFDGKTLLEVLKKGGGGKYAFGRHAVAAFLNAHSDDVIYPRSPTSVASIVDGLGDDSSKGLYNFWKNRFERDNQLGCPL